ncbi:MAG: hypothetical protein ACMG6E_01170 [Candidatus Roizmanbacteria bacterium]
MKKITSTILGLALAFGMVSPAFAVGPTINKASGNIKYTAYSAVKRNADFGFVSVNQSCSYNWNVSNTYVVSFMLDGDMISTYPHDAVLTQTGTAILGTGGHPASGPYVYTWHVTSGTITGNAVNLTILYDTGAPGTVMTMTGTIAPNGSMIGTWTDNFGGTRTGTWSTTSGVATKTFAGGCGADGAFAYHDALNNNYVVQVKFANYSGNKAWFAGPVIAGNVGIGSWLFAEIQDVANPGAALDKVWGSFASEANAILGVATMADPSDGPFVISGGNLKVQ